ACPEAPLLSFRPWYRPRREPSDRAASHCRPVWCSRSPFLGVELRREPRDIRLRTETADRAELVRIDVETGLLLPVDRIDERLDGDSRFGLGQVDAARHLLSREDQLLGLDGAAVADVRDLAGLPRELLGLVRAGDHLIPARDDDVEIG